MGQLSKIYIISTFINFMNDVNIIIYVVQENLLHENALLSDTVKKLNRDVSKVW
jgi:hypothetical protein